MGLGVVVVVGRGWVIVFYCLLRLASIRGSGGHAMLSMGLGGLWMLRGLF